MKVLFTGGGTLGPVTPLIAIWRQMKHLEPECEAFWVGTEKGQERSIVEGERIPYFSMHVAKLPRYFSFDTVRFPLAYWKATQQAKRLLEKIRPDVVVSVGGFMGVPLIRQASKQGIPCAIHQLDAEPGLANRLVAKKCKSVTTSFSYDQPAFPGVESEQLQTPCRFSKNTINKTKTSAKLRLFVLGGGTGAIGLNELIAKSLPKLLKIADITHLTGIGKGAEHQKKIDGYSCNEFFNEHQMLLAYQSADIVIARAGLGTISECAALKKATILVPMPNSHQEKNVAFLGNAVESIVQNAEDASEQLIALIQKKLSKPQDRLLIGLALHEALPTDDGSALAKRWIALIPEKANNK
ncbi:glycosyltransferase [Candidatus Uhrbacteria bacterium]|nr:glycosyltransferase [Candidatus Uhrbacteria bacterium]